MSFSIFGGLIRCSLSVAILMATSGCVIAPMRVQFDPCVGQVAGGATLGGLAGGILGGRAGAIVGAVGAGIATAVQGCHQQAQQGQVGQVVVARPQMVKEKDCTSIGGQLETLNGQTVCRVSIVKVSHPGVVFVERGATKPQQRLCVWKKGYKNSSYPGIPSDGSLQSADDERIGIWSGGDINPKTHTLKSC